MVPPKDWGFGGGKGTVGGIICPGPVKCGRVALGGGVVITFTWAILARLANAFTFTRHGSCKHVGSPAPDPQDIVVQPVV